VHPALVKEADAVEFVAKVSDDTWRVLLRALAVLAFGKVASARGVGERRTVRRPGQRAGDAPSGVGHLTGLAALEGSDEDLILVTAIRHERQVAAVR
jgi:hypothetical protein